MHFTADSKRLVSDRKTFVHSQDRRRALTRYVAAFNVVNRRQLVRIANRYGHSGMTGGFGKNMQWLADIGRDLHKWHVLPESADSAAVNCPDDCSMQCCVARICSQSSQSVESNPPARRIAAVCDAVRSRKSQPRSTTLGVVDPSCVTRRDRFPWGCPEGSNLGHFHPTSTQFFVETIVNKGAPDGISHPDKPRIGSVRNFSCVQFMNYLNLQ